MEEYITSDQKACVGDLDAVEDVDVVKVDHAIAHMHVYINDHI